MPDRTLRRWRTVLIVTALAFGMAVPVVIGIVTTPGQFDNGTAFAGMVSFAIGVAAMLVAVRVDRRIPDHGERPIFLHESR